MKRKFKSNGASRNVRPAGAKRILLRPIKSAQILSGLLKACYPTRLLVGRLDHGRQAFAHFLRPLALGDIDADGYVLVKLSIRAHQSNNRAVDSEDGAVLGAVPNLAAPYSALSDGAVQIPEEFLGVIAGV